MTDCNQINLEALRLKETFDKCYNLKAIDLRDIVELIESVNSCASGSFNLKTINGISLFGSGNINITSTADGTETKIQQGQGVTVSGTGSAANPYVINSTSIPVDGSETKINSGSNVTIGGSGTVSNPYVINAQIPAQDQQVNADWASISGPSKILNKPLIPQAQVNSDWNSSSGPSMILNKPSFSNVNIGYIPNEFGGEITSSSGTSASIPLVTEEFPGLISKSMIDSITIESDNIKKEIEIVMPSGENNIDFAQKINELVTFTVAPNEIPTFKALKLDSELAFVFYIELLGRGKGQYGTGGYQLVSSDVKVTKFLLSTDSLETNENTQTIDLGINNLDIISVINSKMPNIAIQSQEDGYSIIKGTFNTDIYEEYLWVGVGDIYGLGANQAASSDLKRLNNIEVKKSKLDYSGTVKTNLTVADPVVYLKESTDALLNAKQETLVSGTNIKTINGNSLLDSGNLEVKDYIEVDSYSVLISTIGIPEKIYLTRDDNKLYRFNGTIYTSITDGVGNVKLTGDQTITGLKTLQSFGGVPNLKLINNNTADRDNYIQFENPSAVWQLGMKGAASTLFQIKAGDTPYYSVDRFTGNTSIGYNAPTGPNTLFLQDLSSEGSTELVIKEGIGQGNSDFVNIREYGGNNIFRINSQGSLQRRKNLNRLFIFSGDSWSNDIVENTEAGDWPTYFLQRGYQSGESDYLVTAVGGRQVATMLANYTTEIHPYAKTKIEQERTISILGGINDLFGSRSATDIYNDLKSMWLNAKNDGFKVIAFTVCPSVDLTPTQETQRLSLNTLILSDRTLYDFLIRTEILFPNAADTSYFNVDGVHLNSLGAKILGNAVYDYVYTNKYLFNVEPTQPASAGNGTNLIPNSSISNLNLTGTPTAPTATEESAGIQIANKDYVINSLTTKISGSGTTNFIPKFTGSGVIGNSNIFESPLGRIGLNTTNPSSQFEVFGSGVVFKTSGEGTVFNSIANGVDFLNFGLDEIGPFYNSSSMHRFFINGIGEIFSIIPSGNALMNSTSDNGSRLQINGNITASPATLSNQVVVKSQLDLKQNTITGTTNVIPKFGSGGLAESNISQNLNTIFLNTKSEIVSQETNSFLSLLKLLSPNNNTIGNCSQLVFGVDNSINNAADWRYVYQGNGSNSNRVDFGIAGVATPAFSYDFNGNVGIGNITPSEKLEVNGKITALPATLSNQVVVKSQLDLKANLASPALTGTPTATTATAGTNTTQIATTAFVANADSGNVKTTGNQSITGQKTLTNNLTGATSSIRIENQNEGLGQFINNNNSFINSIALRIDTSFGRALFINANGSGNGSTVNSGSSGTGFNYVGQNNGTDTFTVDKLGAIKSGALAGTGSRTVVADSSGVLSAVATIDSRPYKVYTALISQTGTNAPVATVLENTLGTSINYTYGGVGFFNATLAAGGLFIDGKTYVTLNLGNSTMAIRSIRARRTSTSVINIQTMDSSLNPLNEVINDNATFEVRVYN